MKKTTKIIIGLIFFLILAVIALGMYKFNYLAWQPWYDVDGNRVELSQISSNSNDNEMKISEITTENKVDEKIIPNSPRIDSYFCKDDKKFRIFYGRYGMENKYVKIDDDEIILEEISDEWMVNSHSLKKTPSASGEKYENKDGLTFWWKSNTAFVMKNDDIIYNDCFIKSTDNSNSEKLITSFKWFELYSWEENWEWNFSLLEWTNRIKNCDEIIENKVIWIDKWIKILKNIDKTYLFEIIERVNNCKDFKKAPKELLIK